MKNKSGLDKSRLLLGLIAVIAIGVAIFLFTQIRTDKVRGALLQDKPLLVMLVIEQDKKPLTNEVLFLNPKTRKTALIDIPAWTGSLMPSLGRVDGLNALYNPADMKEYLAAAENFLGQPVPFYLILDLESASRAVDLLAGLEIFIASSVEETNSSPLVLLPSGSVQLDGAKIADLLTYAEEGETSADRTSRYQKFTQSLLRKIGESKDYLLDSRVFDIFYTCFRSNVEDKGLRTLITEMATADLERVIFQRVMGTEKLVDGKRLLFPHINGNLLKETVRQVIDSLASTELAASTGVSVTVEIQNGTIRQGLATRTNQIYKSFGYDVAATKNAEDTNVDKTVVIDRKNNLVQAKKVAELIKCKNVLSEAKYFNDGEVDVTIILGKDFDGRYVRSEE